MSFDWSILTAVEGTQDCNSLCRLFFLCCIFCSRVIDIQQLDYKARPIKVHTHITFWIIENFHPYFYEIHVRWYVTSTRIHHGGTSLQIQIYRSLMTGDFQQPLYCINGVTGCPSRQLRLTSKKHTTYLRNYLSPDWKNIDRPMSTYQVCLVKISEFDFGLRHGFRSICWIHPQFLKIKTVDAT